MKFSKAVLKTKDQDEAVRVPVTITEAAEMTLCPNEEGHAYHKMACLENAASVVSI